MPQVGAFFSGFASGFSSVFGGGSGAVSVGGGASAAGAAAAGVTAGGYVGTALAITAVNLGIGALTQKSLGSGGRALAQALDNSIDSMPPKRFIYGETRVGATVVYAKALQNYTAASPGATDSKKNQIIHLVLEIAGHPCEAVDQVYFKDTPLNLVKASSSPKEDLFPNLQGDWGLDTDGVTRYVPNGTPYDDYMMFKIYTGGQTSADQDLLDAMTANQISDWDDSYVGFGKTYVYVRAVFKPKLFQGIPQFSFDVRGKNDVYDPATTSSGYSTDPILCLRDYMVTPRNEGGFGEDPANINDTVAIASSDWCSNPANAVTVFDDGTTQTRYFCGGMFTSAQEPQEIIQDFLETCAGWIEWVDGQWWLNAGEYTAPVMTLTESEYADYPQWQLNRSDREAINSVKPIIRSNETAWQPSNVDAIEALRKVWGSTATDVFTSNSAHNLSVGDRVRFDYWTGTAIDNTQLSSYNLEDALYYYVIEVPSSTTFKVSDTEGGTAVTFGSSSGELTAVHDVYLSKDKERRSIEQVFSLVNDETLARRLGIITLRKARQEMSGVLPCKIGTPYACPFDLMVGDNFRLLDNHMKFWEQTWSTSGESVVYNAGQDRYEISKVAHGRTTGDPVVVKVADTTGLEIDRVYYAVVYDVDTFGLSHYRGGPNIIEAAGTIDYIGVQGKLFTVLGWEFKFEDWTPLVLLSVQATADNIYDWTNDREVDPPNAPGITTNDIANVETPQNVVVDTGTDALYIQKDGTIISRVKFTWDEALDAFILEDGLAQFQYRPNGGTEADWISWEDVPGSATETFKTGPVDGSFYDFRMRFKNSFGFTSDWVTFIAVEMLGKTEAPNNVQALALDEYDEQTLTASFSWTDPADLDLARIEFWYDVDLGAGYSGTLKYAGAVLPGEEEFKHRGVFSQGASSDWKWVVKTVDTSGNISVNEPWPEVISTINPLAGLANFTATARASASGGLRFTPTWDDDGVSGSETHIQYWIDTPGGDKKAKWAIADTSETTIDVDIEHGLDADYWIRAYRVVPIGGQMVWSEPVWYEVAGSPATLTINPDTQPPNPVTAGNSGSYSKERKEVPIAWTDPTGEDFEKVNIYRAITVTISFPSSGWEKIATVPKGAEIYTDHGVYASGQTQYFHYHLRAADKSGNEDNTQTFNEQWVRLTISPEAAPSVTSISALAGGRRVGVDWNSFPQFSDDWMGIQVWPDEANGIDKATWHWTAFAEEHLTILIPVGEAGKNYWVRCYRVSKYNSASIWSAPYNLGSSIFVDEDTVAPAVVQNVSASWDSDTGFATVEWDPNTEIDLSHYEVWRRISGGTWGKLPDVPAGKNNTAGEKPRFQEQLRPESGDSTDYQYLVKAVDQTNNIGNPGYSSDITVDAPAAPIVTVGATATGPAITLSWTSLAKYANHTLMVQWAPNDLGWDDAQWHQAVYGDNSAKIYVPNTHEKIDVTNGFKVRAWRVSGSAHAPFWSKESTTYTVTVNKDTTPPSAPGSVTAEARLNGVRIQWVNPTSADFEYVEVQSSDTGITSPNTYRTIAKIKAEEYIDTDISSNTSQKMI